MVDVSGVVTAHAEIRGLENFFLQHLLEELGDDKDALKAFEVSFHIPKTVEEAKELDKLGVRLIDVQGAIGLNDSGENWRLFQVTIEEGHDDNTDKEIAKQLAYECLKCVAQLRRESGLSVHKIRDRQLKKYNKA